MSLPESLFQRSLTEALHDDNYKPVVVMGDGQIAMMLVQECHRFNLPVIIIGNWSPESSPKSSVQAMGPDDYYIDLGADWDISSQQKSMEALVEKIEKTGGWVTAEWENVPENLLNFFEEKWIRLTPWKKAFETMSDKGKEKWFFDKNTIPCTEWCSVDESLIPEKAEKYLPGFLKSCRGWYDSRGQINVTNFQEFCDAKTQLPWPYILEKKVDLDYEMSVIFARDESWKIIIISTQRNLQDWPLITSVSGLWKISEEIESQAICIAIKAAEGLGYVGTGAMEFFVTKDGKVLANEMAPRPHNSGHQTIMSHEINQFTTQALIAFNRYAVWEIIQWRIEGISTEQIHECLPWDISEHYRARPRFPDMITVLINVVDNRADWHFPDDTWTQSPWQPHPGFALDTPVTTWYGKPKDKKTKHGHFVVTGTSQQVHEKAEKILKHCYPENYEAYFRQTFPS